MLNAIKSGEWVDAARIMRVARIVLLFSVLIIAALVITSGEDFFSFWSAGTLAADDAPEAVYDARVHFKAHQRILAEENPPFYPFFYPPFFLFPALIFALLPLKASSEPAMSSRMRVSSS